MELIFVRHLRAVTDNQNVWITHPLKGAKYLPR